MNSSDDDISIRFSKKQNKILCNLTNKFLNDLVDVSINFYKSNPENFKRPEIIMTIALEKLISTYISAHLDDKDSNINKFLELFLADVKKYVNNCNKHAAENFSVEA